MQARIKNPAITVPGALEAFQQLAASATSAGIAETTLYLVQLRASQINGCSGPGPGGRTGLERGLDGRGGEVGGLRVDDDVPAEQHAAA